MMIEGMTRLLRPAKEITYDNHHKYAKKFIEIFDNNKNYSY